MNDTYYGMCRNGKNPDECRYAAKGTNGTVCVNGPMNASICCQPHYRKDLNYSYVQSEKKTSKEGTPQT